MTVAGAGAPEDSTWGLAGLDPHLAEDWQVWSVVLGRTIQPAMEGLRSRLPGLVSAIACTSDGFNLCALDTDDQEVTRMAALTSSLFALGVANGSQRAPEPMKDATLLVTEIENRRTVIVSRRQQLMGHALVQIVADDTSLGHLIMVANACADEVSRLLDLQGSSTQ